MSQRERQGMPSARLCAYACVTSAQRRCGGRHSHMSLRTDSVTWQLQSGKAAGLTPLPASCERLYKHPKALRFLAIHFQCHIFSLPCYLYPWP